MPGEDDGTATRPGLEGRSSDDGEHDDFGPDEFDEVTKSGDDYELSEAPSPDPTAEANNPKRDDAASDSSSDEASGGEAEDNGAGSLGVVLIDGDASHIANLYDSLPDASGGRIEIRGTATRADAALEAVDARRPDVVVLGLNLDGGSLELLAKLLGHEAQPKVVAVAADDIADAAEGAALGAHAVVSRDTPAAHLLAPILGVVQGWRVVADPVVAELVAGARRPGAERLAELDDETVQLWMLVAEGLDLPTIAERLEIDEAATKQRVSELRRKVGAANRTQLAALAGRAGLVDDGWLDGTVPGN